ncbi:MAG: ComF family protein [Thermodesulfobacteriota bacterium]
MAHNPAVPPLTKKTRELPALLATLCHLCFPPRCLLCQTPLSQANPRLCQPCRLKLPLLQHPICPTCGTTFPNCGSSEDHLCGPCHKKPGPLRLRRSVFAYDAGVAQLIHDLKFGGRFYGLGTMADLARHSELLRDLSEPDLIIPVPLHPSRLKERGFNQAALLARALFPSRRAKIALRLLKRQQATVPQSRLSGRERRRNLGHAFTVTNSGRLRDKAILLVDDVTTSGTTLNECAKTLLAAGAARVEGVTLAMALKK